MRAVREFDFFNGFTSPTGSLLTLWDVLDILVSAVFILAEKIQN